MSGFERITTVNFHVLNAAFNDLGTVYQINIRDMQNKRFLLRVAQHGASGFVHVLQLALCIH